MHCNKMDPWPYNHDDMPQLHHTQYTLASIHEHNSQILQTVLTSS